jgi:hypoxanthine phosphoribosyltransferase
MYKELDCLITQKEINAIVRRLAQEIDRDYAHRSPVLVGVLKGAFIYLADLVRKMKTPIRSIEFLRLSSYGASTVSSGRAVVVMGLPKETVQNQDIILVEDIVDTGITTVAAMRYLKRYKPASLRLCALLDKPARRRVSVAIDYVGRQAPDRFVVGYGIDFNEQYRQLPAIYVLKE